jgi:putative acetyltransferase
MNTIIRLEQPSDIPAVQELVSDAFQDTETAELLSALRHSDCWRNLSFVATFEDQLIAHVAFTRGWLDTPNKLLEVLILSPVSVAQIHQHKGIGSNLILESLKRLQNRPEPLVFLEGNPAFY